MPLSGALLNVARLLRYSRTERVSRAPKAVFGVGTRPALPGAMNALEIGHFRRPGGEPGAAANDGSFTPADGSGSEHERHLPLELLSLGEQLVRLDDEAFGFWRSLVAGSAVWASGNAARSTWNELVAGNSEL